MLQLFVISFSLKQVNPVILKTMLLKSHKFLHLPFHKRPGRVLWIYQTPNTLRLGKAEVLSDKSLSQPAIGSALVLPENSVCTARPAGLHCSALELEQQPL
jgi:hypothetical protein